jgi:SH3-like domain-containing protein
MQSPHYRYFIELQPPSGEPVPRSRETEARRAAARGFIEQMRGWINEKKLDGKVSALTITMLGQIQITCDTAVINLIRNQDDIAAIRQSAMYAETPIRWNEAH